MDKLDKLHKQKFVVSKSSNLIGVIVGIVSVVGLGLVTIGGIVMYRFRSVNVRHEYRNVTVNETNDNVEVVLQASKLRLPQVRELLADL